MFNPFSDAGVVVINGAALEILNFFQSSRRIEDGISTFSRFPLSQVEETIAKLIELGLLHKASEIVRTVPAKPKHLTVWMHVTNDCNLRCVYCYLHRTPDEMPFNIGRKALETVFRTAEKRQFEGIRIKYAGGEPTLGFNRVIELHKYARNLMRICPLDLDEVVLCNGVCITGEMIDALRDNAIRLMISLDGIGEYHDAHRVFANGRGSFLTVAKAIDRLMQKGLVPHISVTISDENVEGLPETVAYLLERDLPFSLNFYRENDCSMRFRDLRLREERMVEGMRRAFQVIEGKMPRRSLLGSIIDRAQFVTPHDLSCGVANSYLVIDQNGKIGKCHMAIQKPITDIYADDPLQAIRSDQIGVQNPKVDHKQSCQDCVWRYWCAGGCPMATFRATGRYDVKSPNCDIYKAIFPEALRLEGLRLLKYHNEDSSVEMRYSPKMSESDVLFGETVSV